MVVAAIDSQVPKLDDRISLWQVLRKNEALANISEGLSAHGVSGSNKANPTWLTEFHSHMYVVASQKLISKIGRLEGRGGQDSLTESNPHREVMPACTTHLQMWTYR